MAQRSARGGLKNIRARATVLPRASGIPLITPPATPVSRNINLGQLSSSESESIYALSYTDGTPLLTNEVRYEILNLLLSLDYSTLYSFLTSQPWSSAKELILALPNLNAAREKAEEEIGISQQKIRASSGIYKCTRCGSMRTIDVEQQIRSCDEPKTLFVTCQDCGWKKIYG